MGKTLTKEKQPEPKPIIPVVESEDDAASISKLLTHPLFRQSQDPLLSAIIEPLKQILQPTQNNIRGQQQLFIKRLGQVLPENRTLAQLAANEFKKVNESNKTICWKVIPIDDVFFRCLDCEADQISVQCKECFENVDHKGHRVMKCKPQSDGYTCDCGVLDTIHLQGTCPNHLPKDQTIEEALLDFPQEIRQKFTETYTKAIYGILSIFEIQEKARNRRLKAQMSKLGQECMVGFLTVYSFYTDQVSKSFSLVLERVLRSTLQAPYNLVWHDCNDLRDEYLAKNSESEPPKECSCTVLGCIFRFAKYLPKSGQSQLKSILIESCKEKTSTRFLGREISKYAYFLFGDPFNKDNEARKHSSEAAMAVRNEFSLDEEDFIYIDYVLGALRRLLKGCDVVDQEMIEVIYQLTSPLANFITIGSKASEKVLYQTDFMAKLLEILANFQVTYLYPGEIRLGLFEHNVDYYGLTMKPFVERSIYLDLDHGLKMLGDLPLEKREPEFKRIGKEWYSQFQKAHMIQDHQRLYNKQINTLSGLEKTLCLMILHYLQDNISKQSLEDFFRSIFPDVYPSVLASNAIRGSLITLGLMRFTDIIRTSTMGERSLYYTFMNLYEFDVVLVQLMTLLVKPQDLFILFTNSFFSYAKELRDLCTPLFTPQLFRDHPHSKQITLALQDFLEFFIYVMNDEISLMNLNIREKVSRERPDVPPERVLKKIFVNILAEMNWFDVSTVKTAAQIFIGDNLPTSVDSILAKIVIKNEKYKIKLKQEYESDLDPYLFYKSYYDQRSRQNDLTSQDMKTQNRDIVSGKFYTDLPLYHTDIQQNIFQSELPDFVTQIIINFTKDISRLLQPALKLVLFNLQVVNEALENPNSNTENLQKKAQANYLTKSFSQSLNKILAEGYYKECEQCIHNIQGLIKQLSSRALLRQQSTEQNLVEEHKEDPVAEKKRQAKEKMEKMKEEFAKKKAAFAQKNEDLLHQEDAESQEQVIENSPEKKDLVCQYCLDRIDELSSEEYGVPLYIEFTNNFYNIVEEESALKKGNSTDLSKIDWWPVISSCHHSYHRRCFDKHCQSSRGPQNESSQFFSNDVEVQCALCKKLHNSFLVMNTELASGTSEGSSARYILIIQHLLAIREDNLRSSKDRVRQGNSFNLTLQEGLKRTYEYFVESFHVSPRSHSLEKNFELYLNFFKILTSCLPITNEGTLEKKSFLKEIFSQNEKKKVCPDLAANHMFSNLLAEKFSLPKAEREFTVDEHLQIIKEYLIFNIVSLAHSKRPENVTQLSDTLPLYKENKEFKTDVTRELVFPIKKLLLAYYLNKCMFLSSNKTPEKSEFCKVLSSSDNNAETLDALLKLAGVPLSFDQRVEEALSLIDTFPESEKNLLSSMLNPEIPPVLIRKLKLAPKFHAATFPKTYLEFSQIYVSKKCDLCNNYDQRFLQCVCLICGEVICMGGCQGKMEIPGNLTKHSNKHHMGLGLFFSIDHQVVFGIKSPLGLLYWVGHLYVNELGESMSTIMVEKEFSARLPKDVDFQKYALDERTLKNLERVVMEHSIGQEIFENAPTNSQQFFTDLRL